MNFKDFSTALPRSVVILLIALAVTTSAWADNWISVLSFQSSEGEPANVLIDIESLEIDGDIAVYWRWMRSPTLDASSRASYFSDPKYGGYDQSQIRLDCRAMVEMEIATRFVSPDTNTVIRILHRDTAYSERTKRYYSPGTVGFSNAKRICELAHERAGRQHDESPLGSSKAASPCKVAWERPQPDEGKARELLKLCNERATIQHDPIDEYLFAMLTRGGFDRRIGAAARLKQAQGVIDSSFQNADLENLRVVISWLERSAKQGYLQAQLELGSIYSADYKSSSAENHLAPASDSQRAVYWLTSAARRGNAEAQYELARHYLSGDGVEQNLRMALALLASSARQENVRAPGRIALIYLSLGTDFGDAVAEAWHLYFRELQSRDSTRAAFLALDEPVWRAARDIRQRRPLSADGASVARELLSEIRQGQFNDLALPVSLAEALKSLNKSLEGDAVKKRVLM